MRRHGILWEWESRRSKRFEYSLNERKGAVRMLRSNGMVDVVDRCIGWMSASLRTRAWWWCIWWIWTVCLFLFYGGGGEEDDRPVDARTGCIQKKREVRLLQRSRDETKLDYIRSTSTASRWSDSEWNTSYVVRKADLQHREESIEEANDAPRTTPR